MSTIFAAITSQFRAGIAVLRISGPQTVSCLKILGFKGLPQHQRISLQKIRDPKNSAIIDEALISFFAAPKSFTGEDIAEISVHASSFIIKKIFEILSEVKDTRLAQAGEFSRRAFLNGKIDLVQAEAIPDLIAAETEMQHKQALKQLEGQLGKIYENWRFRLIEILAMIEAAIDFPEEDLPENIIDKVVAEAQKLSAEITAHLDDKKIGQRIKNGLNLAIIGAPNTGKSSLMNFLAQSEIAIVSEIAGTTRDVIETHLAIKGVAVKISDTAGLRQTSDKIEAEGISRALKKAREADIKIFLFDVLNLIQNNDLSLNIDLIDENTILVINKVDLLPSGMNSLLHKKPFREFMLQNKDLLQISLKKNINTLQLLKKIEEKILDIIPLQTSPLITQERYRAALKNALLSLKNFLKNFSPKKNMKNMKNMTEKNMPGGNMPGGNIGKNPEQNIEFAAEDLRIAACEIGKITGMVDIENVLDVIFSRFCIGK
jgi:tRNA modification GTPase